MVVMIRLSPNITIHIRGDSKIVLLTASIQNEIEFGRVDPLKAIRGARR